MVEPIKKMKKLFLVVLVFNSSSFVFAQAPGNVSGSLIWWLKSNLDVLEANGSTAEDGDGVDVWDDKSSGDIDAETGSEGSAATRPIYRTGIINGNPALEFDGTKFLDGENVSGVGPTESFHMFLVFKQTNFQTIADGRYDDQGTFIIDRPTGTAALASFKVVHVDNGDGDASNDDRYFYQRRQDDNSNLDGPVSASAVNTTSFVIAEYFRTRASAASSTEGIYLDGGLEISQAGPTGNITGEITRIGMHADRSGNGLEGYMTEVILYNNNLSTANRQRIESYLAIKYGITLNSGMDYVRQWYRYLSIYR